MTDITINQVELSNFQELLQYFIAHLEFVTNEKDLSYKKRVILVQM